tara:strand:- start:237 stop:377 length:141 start_codon:yes stop_codon:yes gene_type:complete
LTEIDLERLGIIIDAVVSLETLSFLNLAEDIEDPPSFAVLKLPDKS